MNLEDAASTPTFAPIWEFVWQSWLQPRQVQELVVHDVKSICVDVLGASLTSHDVIFTSNTTEAINLVAESLHNEFGAGCRTGRSQYIA